MEVYPFPCNLPCITDTMVLVLVGIVITSSSLFPVIFLYFPLLPRATNEDLVVG